MLDSETEPPSQLSLRNDLSLSGSWIEDCVMVGGGGGGGGGVLWGDGLGPSVLMTWLSMRKCGYV